jgi:hypothetical protein
VWVYCLLLWYCCTVRSEVGKMLCKQASKALSYNDARRFGKLFQRVNFMTDVNFVDLQLFQPHPSVFFLKGFERR